MVLVIVKNNKEPRQQQGRKNTKHDPGINIWHISPNLWECTH